MVSIISDVDGCLVPGRGQSWDFAGLQELSTFNREKKHDFVLCSSRPATFLEAIARQVLVSNYCICENGTMLFHPLTKDVIIHPDIPQDFIAEQSQIQRILTELIEDKPVVVEIGKLYTFSVNTQDQSLVPDLFETISEQLKGAPVEIFKSQRSVEVMPHGINKAKGIELWCKVTNTNLQQVLAIGDTDNDLPMLRYAPRSAAPANSSKKVQCQVDYLSEYPLVQGVLDIYQRAEVILKQE